MSDETESEQDFITVTVCKIAALTTLKCTTGIAIDTLKKVKYTILTAQRVYMADGTYVNAFGLELSYDARELSGIRKVHVPEPYTCVMLPDAGSIVDFFTKYLSHVVRIETRIPTSTAREILALNPSEPLRKNCNAQLPFPNTSQSKPEKCVTSSIEHEESPPNFEAFGLCDRKTKGGWSHEITSPHTFVDSPEIIFFSAKIDLPTFRNATMICFSNGKEAGLLENTARLVAFTEVTRDKRFVFQSSLDAEQLTILKKHLNQKKASKDIDQLLAFYEAVNAGALFPYEVPDE